MDIGQTVGGKRMQGTISLAPFQIKYPKGYTDQTQALQVVARVPILSTGDPDSASVKAIDFSKKVCLSTLGDKFKQGGTLKRPIQAVGVALGMIGADFCIEFPGLDTSGSDLEFGFKMEMTAFDKSKIDVTNFLKLLPAAWNKMTADLTGGSGIKDLMTTALELKPLESCPSAVCGTYSTVSLKSKMKELITATFPASPITKSIDIGKMIGSIDAMKAFMSGDKFKLPNMFGGGRRRELRGNPDAAPYPLALAPPIVHSLVPSGVQSIEIGEEQSEYFARRLAADFTIKFKYKTFIVEGSQCELTIQAMPKKIHCIVKLKIGPKISAEIEGEFLLAYQLDGENFEIIARAKAKMMAGTAADYGFSGSDDLAKIDFGGLVDDSLAGTISVIPVGIEFPKTGMYEIARVKVDTLKAQGACLGNMEELAPQAQKPDVKNLADIVKKVTGFVGGDICLKTPGLDLSDGFKLDVNAVLTIFDPALVNIYPIVDIIKSAEPSLATVITAIQAVFGPAIKTAMNNAAKAVMPAQQDFTINMGKLIAAAGDATKEAAGFAGSKLPTRRRLETKPGEAGDDGKFNLGGVKASQNPKSKNNGDFKAAEKAGAASNPDGSTLEPDDGTGGAPSPAADATGGCDAGCAVGITFAVLFLVVCPLACLGHYCYAKKLEEADDPERKYTIGEHVAKYKGKFGKKAASEEKPKKRATEMTNPMNKNKNTGSPPGLTQQVEAVAEPEDPASGAEIHTDPASGRRYSYFPATGATEWLPEAPAPAPPPQAPQPPQPEPNIEIHTDPGTGKRYSWNPETNETKWLMD
jgi:hypothetical protein